MDELLPAVRAGGGREAVKVGDRSLTYGQLLDAASVAATEAGMEWRPTSSVSVIRGLAAAPASIRLPEGSATPAPC